MSAARLVWSAGHPGQHAGISHLRKHWLNPPEFWEDLCEETPDPHRPWCLRRALGAQIDAADEGLDEVTWAQLERAFAGGYRPLVFAAVETSLGAPSAAGWVTHQRDRQVAHVGDGVLVAVVAHTGATRVLTAYRPEIAPLGSYDAPRVDRAHRKVRMLVADVKARQIMAGRRRRGSDAESEGGT